jgi:hypothetical protein
MSSLLDLWPNGLYRTFHDAAHYDLLTAKLHSPRGNARHFEQVVYQSLHVLHLTFDNIAGLLLY